MSRPLVALDGRRLQDRPPGGVGRALACVLPHLVERCDVTILTDATRPAPNDVAGARIVPLPRPRGLPEAGWLHWSARRWSERRPHTFHGTFNAIPFRLSHPSVVTIHDLTFELHPEDFDTARRRAVWQWFRLNARYAAAHASAVVTVSAFSADAIAEHYGIARDRLVVIPNAADPLFDPANAAEAPAVCARLGVRRPYAVAVGGAHRRGAEVAIDAWRLVRARGVDVDLVVLGRVAAEPQPGLHLTRGLDDPSWAALLAGATALVYPTRYEGFGLPGLEALASGTPVVAAPTSSLPEVLGAAAEWCDHPTPEAMAAGLERVVVDEGRARELRTLGLAHVAAWPSWDDIAQRHTDVYAQVGSGATGRELER